MAKGVVFGGLNGGGGSNIKSIQKGLVSKNSVTQSLNVAINPVDLSKSIVLATSRHTSGTTDASKILKK
jgi:hypothetical protein